MFATTSSTVTPPAPVDVAFYSDASNLSTQVADDTTLDLGSQVPETPDKEDYALPSDAQERARKLADEDKRRRNTAASARFRHKKKGQEKEMQKKIQAMANEIAELRNKVRKLEVEKTAYRDLLIAKTAGEPKGSEAGPAPAGAKHEAEAVKSTGHKRTRLENWA